MTTRRAVRTCARYQSFNFVGSPLMKNKLSSAGIELTHLRGRLGVMYTIGRSLCARSDLQNNWKWSSSSSTHSFEDTITCPEIFIGGAVSARLSRRTRWKRSSVLALASTAIAAVYNLCAPGDLRCCCDSCSAAAALFSREMRSFSDMALSANPTRLAALRPLAPRRNTLSSWAAMPPGAARVCTAAPPVWVSMCKGWSCCRATESDRLRFTWGTAPSLGSGVAVRPASGTPGAADVELAERGDELSSEARAVSMPLREPVDPPVSCLAMAPGM